MDAAAEQMIVSLIKALRDLDGGRRSEAIHELSIRLDHAGLGAELLEWLAKRPSCRAIAKRLPQFLSIKQTAVILGCTTGMVHGLIKSATLEAINIANDGAGKAYWAVPEKGLRRFINARERASPYRTNLANDLLV